MFETPSADAEIDAGSALEDLLNQRLALLTLPQKIRLLTGATAWSLYSEPTIGLRTVVVSDGPAGVRGQVWDERDTSVNIPAPSALAASWDPARAYALGRLLAAESRRKGVDVLLAPTVNLHRTPFGGRHFECFSEDPGLTGVIATAYIRGLQESGVGATVKHFVANDSETERQSVDVHVDERTLRELYLLPFETVVRAAGVWAVMASYNGVNGSAMSESPLLRQVLKEEWGFDGLVMTDWGAARSNEPTARAGMDLIMPGPRSAWSDGLLDAVQRGEVDEGLIDDKVRRVLRLAARVGALEGATPAAPAPDQPSAAQVADELRAAAAASFVLLRNENGALPLAAQELRRVAVLGPNAAIARTNGGGSATVVPPYTVSPLEGLNAAIGAQADVVHSVGVHATDRIAIATDEFLRNPDTDEPGMRVGLLDADDQVLRVDHRSRGHFTGPDSVAPDLPVEQVKVIEVTARLTAPTTGTYVIGCSGVGGFEVTIDGSEVATGDLALPDDADVVEGFMKPPQLRASVELAAGQERTLVVRHTVQPGVLVMVFQVNLDVPRDSDEVELDRAVELARDADVAVVVVGTTEEVESEGFDRLSLALPGRQDELVRRVAAVNPRTVVVVNAGAPVLLPWRHEVSAVLIGWFPGQEFGTALADVLLGVVEPGGRLPTTWPLTESPALPSTRPVDGRLDYAEGVFVGYRSAGRGDDGYGFGHGLGYTQWRYLAMDIAPDGRSVRVTIRNAGSRSGREVVQIYAQRPSSSVPRPVRWLIGFGSVVAAAGEQVDVVVPLFGRSFDHWDVAEHRWVREPGQFDIFCGRSSRDVILSGQLLLGGDESPLADEA